jgi:HAMP domain-containing protein
VSSSDQRIVTPAGGRAARDGAQTPAQDETISGPLPLLFTIVTTPSTKTLTASAAAPGETPAAEAAMVSGEVTAMTSGTTSAAETVAAVADMVCAAPAEGASDLPPAQVSSISVVGTRLGLGFDPTAAWNGRRSSQVVEQPIVGTDGEAFGTLRFSNGPAYGLDIVAGVARGWALASLVAVALAALVGWRISRSVSRPVLALTAATARMATGDLAVRVTVARRDEFGQLAASFNRMAHQLAGTIAALRRFVADAAHELHTPLTALHTDLELAAGEVADAARHELVIRAQAHWGG